MAGSVTGAQFGSTTGAGIGVTAGLVLAVLDDPVVKSKISILIDKLQKRGIKVSESWLTQKLLTEQALRTAKGVKEGEK